MTNLRSIKDDLTVLPQVQETGQNSMSVKACALALRPLQWVKNTLVFGALVFSHSLLDWNAIRFSISAFLLFCAASSGIYLLNDLRDLEQDRKHPTKRLRPLASGAVDPSAAFGMMVVLLAGSLVGSLFLRAEFAVILLSYVILNIAYSFGLKRMVIVDVMVIALGFVFRAVAGAVVIAVATSPWLILCTLTLALLVGFGKRRHELSLLGNEAQNHRASLESYSLPFLDMMMGISGATAVVTYSLYTLAAETVARVGTHYLVLTVPWVMYGIFRYLYLVHQRRKGGDPSHLFVSDTPTLVNAILWAVTVCLVIYYRPL